MNRIPKLTTATELHYNLLAIKANELIDKLDRYKSIVKKVDPDNLPEGCVLAFGEGLEMGTLHKMGLDIICENDSDCILGITHYIDYKDLIKLFTGDV